MKAATHHLLQEHEKIEPMLKAFENACRLLKTGALLPREEMETALEFFKIFADKIHHAKEEEILLPALMSKGFPLPGGPLCSYFQELHMTRTPLLDQIREVESFLGDKDEKRPATLLPESIPIIQEHALGRRLVQAMQLHWGQSHFAEFATQFIDFLREHIDKENRCLFPMCDHHLEEEEQKILLKQFEEIDEKICAGHDFEALKKKWKDFQKKYERLV